MRNQEARRRIGGDEEISENWEGEFKESGEAPNHQWHDLTMS